MKTHYRYDIRPGWREWPTVLLLLHGQRPEVEARLLALSRELNWNVVDNRRRGARWPPELDPQGAVVVEPDGEDVEELLKRGCPTVRIGRAPHPNDDRIPVAMHDLVAAGRMAAEHFEARHFKHVAFVGFGIRKGNRVQGQLYEGFHERATELGCTCHLLSIEPGDVPRTKSGPEYYRQHLLWFAEKIRALPRPFGLFVFSDGFADACCCMCEDLGLAVPEDVAILGVGNNEFMCMCSKPPVSSIAFDDVAQAETAARLLRDLMMDRRVAQPVVMIPPLGVVERESTNAIGTHDPEVAAAIHYMWDHLRTNLTIDEVAREVGVSRTTLDRRFKRELGRSVDAELRRKRLEVLCRLLLSTEEPIADLVAKVGFSSREHLHRVFRQVFGMSPRQYRQRGQGAG